MLSDNKKLRPQVAMLSPSQLILRPYFWVYQTRFILVVAIGVLAIWYLESFTYAEVGSLQYLTAAVQLLALWGSGLALRALARLEVEMAIIGEIEEAGATYLRKIKSSQEERADIDKIEEDILPNNLTQPAPAMMRLFKHICKEAKERRFESSVNLVQPYHEEPLDDIFRLQNLQKIALWLGILGTFVGLLIVIQVSDLKGLKTNEDFAGLIAKMFGGLVVSFGASLAGLEVAVVLGFLLLLLRKKQELYFKMMESAVATMLSLARNSIVRDDFLAEFAQITTSVTTLSDRVYDQTQEMSKRLGEVRDRVGSQTAAIQSGLSNLTKVKSEFETSLQEVTKAQRQFIEDVKTIYSAISLKDLSTALETGIRQAGVQISATLDPNVRSISRQLEQFNSVLQSLNTTVTNQSRAAAESANKTEKRVAEFAAENVKTVNEIRKQMQRDLATVESGVARAVKEDLKQLTRTTAGPADAVGRARFRAPTRGRRGGFWSSVRDWINDRS